MEYRKNNCNCNKCCARIMPFRSISNFELKLLNSIPTVINANIGQYFYLEKLSKILSHCRKKIFFLFRADLKKQK